MGSMAGRKRAFRKRRRGRHKDAWISIERLLDRPTEREKAALDDRRHLADVIDGSSPVLEDARRPRNLICDLVDLALIMPRCILQRSQIESIRPDPAGELLLLAREPLDAAHDVRALPVQRVEQPGE